jgi:hypothetical protein
VSAADDVRRQVRLATKAQDQVDQLAASGTAAGAAALASTRAAVRRALRESRSPEELRHHLIQVLHMVSADALAKQLAKAKTMGNALGSLAVLDEIST